jgi:riboflavin biosynthesis pyrimidine reductase
VPLRPLGEQAVLRRLACPDRVEGGGVTGESAQRKLILCMSMSLDGFVARREGTIDWLDGAVTVTYTDRVRPS